MADCLTSWSLMWRSSMFFQLHDKLTNWIVEVAGFNQPTQLSTKNFRKRQLTLNGAWFDISQGELNVFVEAERRWTVV